nr:hypothetical protein [Tanacetum cinerariifolium]
MLRPKKEETWKSKNTCFSQRVGSISVWRCKSIPNDCWGFSINPMLQVVKYILEGESNQSHTPFDLMYAIVMFDGILLKENSSQLC